MLPQTRRRSFVYLRLRRRLGECCQVTGQPPPMDGRPAVAYVYETIEGKQNRQSSSVSHVFVWKFSKAETLSYQCVHRVVV